MPYVYQWEDPEIRLEYMDVFVYNTYKNDDIENYGSYTYFFTLNQYHVDGDGDDFDVRELPLWKEIYEEKRDILSVEEIISLCLRKSIKAGDLKESIPA